MFYVLSKVLDLAFAPVAWGFVGLGVTAWGVLRNRRRVAVVGLGATVLWLYLFSIEPVARGLVAHAESSAPTTFDMAAPYDAVIMLGGFAGGVRRDALGEGEYSEAVERMIATYTLLRDGRAKQALLSAGGTSQEVEADVVANQLVAWGIDRSRIVSDRVSRNTHENAVESARIIREHGWSKLLLVTSAMHMPRAAGCFKAVGLAFDTLPVDFREGEPADGIERFLPRAGALSSSTEVLRELVGRVVYRMRGYSVAYP